MNSWANLFDTVQGMLGEMWIGIRLDLTSHNGWLLSERVREGRLKWWWGRRKWQKMNEIYLQAFAWRLSILSLHYLKIHMHICIWSHIILWTSWFQKHKWKLDPRSLQNWGASNMNTCNTLGKRWCTWLKLYWHGGWWKGSNVLSIYMEYILKRTLKSIVILVVSWTRFWRW